MSCNLLFIQCDKCKIQNNGCCSPKCIDVVNLPEAKQKILSIQEKLIKVNGNEKTELQKELKNTKRYLKWLKGEVIFTDERAKLHL